MWKRLLFVHNASSLFYLLMPLLLFAWGWMNIPLALLMTAALGYLGWFLLRGDSCNSSSDALNPSTREVLLTVVAILIVAAAWSALSGMGGIGLQNSDYVKHNAMLKDLITHNWPVYYESTVVTNGTPRFLVYAIPFYLPAAALGKVLGGWAVANICHFIWGFIGTVLALFWAVRISGVLRWYVPLSFALFSGIDLLGTYWAKGVLPTPGDHIEWWQGFVQFSSHSTMLFWVPQHAIVGWIGTGILADLFKRSRWNALAIIPCILLPWSPLVAIGMGTIVFIVLSGRPLRDFIHPGALAASILVVAATAPFYSANDMRFPMGFFEGFSPTAENIAKFVVFYVIELLVFAVPVFLLIGDKLKPILLLLAAAGATLVVFPTFKLGAAHDLAMRGTIPALFLLACVVITALHRGSRQSIWWQILLCSCILGAATPLFEIYRSVHFYRFGAEPADGVKGIYELGSSEFVEQYLGKPDTYFFKYEAKSRP